MKSSEKKNLWETINFFMVFVVFGGFMFFMSVGHISSIFYKIGFPVNIALGLIYKNYRKCGRFRKAVIVLRSVAITILVLMVLAPVILLNFRNTKSMYPVKRFCYSYGVYGITDNTILPSGLPEKCDDYLFITQGSMPAQDYHPSAYLVFHTDSETLKEYEEHFSSLDSAELQITHIPEKELKCPTELPRHVFDRLEPEHIHDFKNAIIYTVPAYYNKGCMLDYNSGLAVFWY